MEINPCKQCPYRKDSAPGWLGEASHDPEEFLKQLNLLFVHPCHMAVKWDGKADELEMTMLELIPCHGMLQFAKNICKMLDYPPYETFRRTLKVDDREIFATRQDFINHHLKLIE